MIEWTDEKTHDLLESIITQSESPQIEVGFRSETNNSTRFAGNVIHQSTASNNLSIMVRIALGQKIGSASTNQLDTDSIKWVISKATENANISKPNSNFLGFMKKTESVPLPEPFFCESTAIADPFALAGKAERIIQKAQNKKFEAAGSISTSIQTAAVMTSSYQYVYQSDTSSSALTVVNRPGQAGFGTGYSEFNHRDFNSINSEIIAEEAINISKINHDPQTLDSGIYDVILSPVAVGTLIFYLSWMSFHSTVVATNQSFISNKFGQKVLDEKISIWEDAHDGRNFGRAFDWEGHPTQRTDIIVAGRANDVVYDTISAKKHGKKATGNALGYDRDNYYSSPMTENLIVKKGSESLEEMIRNTDNGIYINRLWYVREINFKDTSITGMTRDGTFLIKEGKISHALHNLRFSISLMDIFNSVDGIGDKLHLSKVPIGTVIAPAMKLNRFFVSGVSIY